MKMFTSNKKRANNILPYICYLNVCILWGITNFAIKIGIEVLNVSVLACCRYFIAGFVALVISLIKRDHAPKSKAEWKAVLMISVLMNFLINGCVVLSNKFLDSGLVTVIFSAVPIFITVLDSLIMKNCKQGLKGWIGFAGGFLGIAFIVLMGNKNVKIDIRGIIFILLAVVFGSVGSVYSKEKETEGSPMVHVAIEALSASLLFFIAGKLTGDFILPEIIGIKPFIPATYLAITDSLIGFLSYIFLLKIWKPAVVSTYAYINPVVALILGAAILKKPLSVEKIGGMVIIILSVILIKKDKKEEVKNVQI